MTQYKVTFRVIGKFDQPRAETYDDLREWLNDLEDYKIEDMEVETIPKEARREE